VISSCKRLFLPSGTSFISFTLILALNAAFYKARPIRILGISELLAFLNNSATYCLPNSSHNPSEARTMDLEFFFRANTLIYGYQVIYGPVKDLSCGWKSWSGDRSFGLLNSLYLRRRSPKEWVGWRRLFT
jgi:hypothetical protein